MSTATLRRRDFPGWRMVWPLSVTCTVAYGVLFYAFAVFLVPMRRAAPRRRAGARRSGGGWTYSVSAVCRPVTR